MLCQEARRAIKICIARPSGVEAKATAAEAEGARRGMTWSGEIVPM